MIQGGLATQLDCRCCDRTTLIENRDTETDWQYVSRNGIVPGDADYATHSATCPECIATAANGAVRSARSRGTVECLHPDHGNHVPVSDAFAACRRKGYLPLTDDEHETIVEAFHDARDWACPDCGRVESLTETTVEYQGFTLDGAACECGWTGRRKELSYRKPTDKDGTTPNSIPQESQQ